MRTELFNRHQANPVTPPEAPPAPVQAPVAPVTPAIFAENVYADAEENCAKIMARKHKRVEEPRLLGLAIRESYAQSPLVRTLQRILHELSEERGTRLGFGFSGPTGLVLTPEGFCVTEPSDDEEADMLVVMPLPDSIAVGADGTCAMMRLNVDAQLKAFAKEPETYAMPVMDKPKVNPKDPKDIKGQKQKLKAARRKPRRGLGGMPLVGKLFR